jgi:NADPH:quinone reductase-like Zn-dependent oxidoreductase
MTPDIPAQMAAVLLTGHGGIDTLSYREDVALPVAGPDEVLIRVAAAGVNNTDINTRIGWYSKKVSDATDSGGADGFENVDDADATFPGSRARTAVALLSRSESRSITRASANG